MYFVCRAVVMAAHSSAVHPPTPAQETVMPWWPVPDCPARILSLCSSTPQVGCFLTLAWKRPLEIPWLYNIALAISNRYILQPWLYYLFAVFTCVHSISCVIISSSSTDRATLRLVLNDMTSDVMSLRNLWSRMPDHRGLPWRGRNPDQQRRREVHGTLRTQCQRFGL